MGTFLARKITLAKWDKKKGLAENEIPADAVTADLRTRNNTISLWRCDGKEKSLKEVVLALASGFQKLERVDIAWVREEDLRDYGLTLQDTEGNTPVSELVDLHVDVVNLDYVRLGYVAKAVADAIAEGRCHRWKAREVKEILMLALEQGRVGVGDLAPELVEKLGLEPGGE